MTSYLHQYPALCIARWRLGVTQHVVWSIGVSETLLQLYVDFGLHLIYGNKPTNHCPAFSSVLWHCWLGIKESIQSVIFGYLSAMQQGANDLHVVQLMTLPSPSYLASNIKMQNDSLFWCWFTQIVLKRRPLNQCCWTCCCCLYVSNT